jgi:hypothetical protein
VTHHVVIRWRRNLPKKRDEPWYLMTNVKGRAEHLCQLYGCRMQVEEPPSTITKEPPDPAADGSLLSPSNTSSPRRELTTPKIIRKVLPLFLQARLS